MSFILWASFLKSCVNLYLPFKSGFIYPKDQEKKIQYIKCEHQQHWAVHSSSIRNFGSLRAYILWSNNSSSMASITMRNGSFQNCMQRRAVYFLTAGNKIRCLWSSYSFGSKYKLQLTGMPILTALKSSLAQSQWSIHLPLLYSSPLSFALLMVSKW